MTFDLQEFARTGTPEVYKEGIEARSMNGSYPLATRSGGGGDGDTGLGLAHVDLSLELAWRSEVEPMFPNSARGLSSLVGSKVGGVSVSGGKRPSFASGQQKSITASTHMSRGPPPSSVAGSSSKAAGVRVPGANAGNAKPKTHTSSTSNASRRNRTEQLRIERENKALQNRLMAQKSKNPTNHKSIQKADDVYAIDAAPKKSADEEAGVDPKFARMVRGMGVSELMDTFNAMKREFAVREKRVKDCHATNSRLKLQTVKYGSTIEKLKKTMPASSASTPSLSSGGKIGSGFAASRASLTSSSKVADSKIAPNSGADEEGGPQRPPAEAKSDVHAMSVEDDIAQKAARRRTGDDVDEVEEGVDIIYDVRDNELKELLNEHRALQEVRRRLVDRVLAVKKITKDSMDAINDAIQGEELARIRIEGISRKAGGSGCAGSCVSEELLAIDRLRGVAIELARTVAAREAGVHLGPLADSIYELQAVYNTLQTHLEIVGKEVDMCRYERDMHYDRFQQLMDGSIARRIRNGISILRTILTRLRTKARVAKYEHGSDNVELEVLRLQLRQQQLKASVGWE